MLLIILIIYHLIYMKNRESYNSFNIILVGKTQSGKSTLINKLQEKYYSFFQGSLRTEDIFVRDIYNKKINLYDTCGVSYVFKPKDIFTKLQKKIELLKDNGEKMDLLLIVIKKEIYQIKLFLVI